MENKIKHIETIRDNLHEILLHTYNDAADNLSPAQRDRFINAQKMAYDKATEAVAVLESTMPADYWKDA